MNGPEGTYQSLHDLGEGCLSDVSYRADKLRSAHACLGPQAYSGSSWLEYQTTEDKLE